MPQRARVPCGHPGCPALTDGGPCPAHRRAADQYDRRTRGSAAQRGYDSRWARYARDYRRRHPLCVACQQEGRTTASAHVDHITPVSGPDDPRFWDETNHQALCQSCHSRKTVVADRRGIGMRQ